MPCFSLYFVNAQLGGFHTHIICPLAAVWRYLTRILDKRNSMLSSKNALNMSLYALRFHP